MKGLLFFNIWKIGINFFSHNFILNHISAYKNVLEKTLSPEMFALFRALDAESEFSEERRLRFISAIQGDVPVMAQVFPSDIYGLQTKF